MMLLRKRVKRIFLLTALLGLFFLFFKGADADTLGQGKNFFVNSKFDKYGRNTLAANLRYVSNKLYFYVDDYYWNTLNSLGQGKLLGNIAVLAGEFENVIYPKEVEIFGSEPDPGIDGDSRITVLLEEVVQGNGGYFETSNLQSPQDIDDSNGREMFAINVESALTNVDLAKVFLAHEFQHLISFNQKDTLKNVAEDVWLNELRSEQAISLVGYDKPFSSSNLKRRIDFFIENPSDSLTEWPNEIADYAIVNAFGRYVVEQYGNSIFTETIKSSFTGISSLNEYLARRGYGERFEDIFGYWMAAMYLNDQSRDSRFGFFDLNLKYLRVRPRQEVNFSNALSDFSTFQSLKPWQPFWLEFNLPQISRDLSKSFKISANGQSGRIFPVFYLAFYNDGSYKFGRIQLSGGKGSVYIVNSESGLNKVVIMATDGTKNSDFGSNEESSTLVLSGSIIETKKAEAQTLKDGSLIKKPREKEIYVIWGKYKRYLMPGVINLYGHLDPTKVIEVEPEIFNSYQTSNYVKYVDDEKVYAVWPEGSKHWLNITPQQWDASSRDWNAIFTINSLELNYYSAGSDIIR